MKEQFLKELGGLLAKYNAEICCYCEGDTTNEVMNIYVNNEVIKKIPGYELSQYDLKEKPTD